MIYERYREKNGSEQISGLVTDTVRDQRVHERIIVKLKAVFTFQDISYVGMIENISEHGFYMISLPIKEHANFIQGAVHEMKLRTAPGQSITLYCKVQWAYKTPPYGLTNSVGMEIIHSLPAYREFLTTLI